MIIRIRTMMEKMREDISKAKRQYPQADFVLVKGEFGGYFLYAEGFNDRLNLLQ